MIRNPLSVLKKFKTESGLPKVMTENKNVLNLISDLIRKRFEHKKPERTFIKIYFDNKGIEMVNLPSLLHQVNDAIPNSFQIRTAPTVLFTRSTIGSKVFN